MRRGRTRPATGPDGVSPDAAVEMIQEGRAPAGLRVSGPLDLSALGGSVPLPAGLTAPAVKLRNCTWLQALPRGWRVRRLDLAGCRQLETLPEDLACAELEASGSGIQRVPPLLRAGLKVDLSDCVHLTEIGAGLAAPVLNLQGCVGLTVLPEGISASFLNVAGCRGLTEWPRQGALSIGRLNMSDCPDLTEVPAWMGSMAQLNVSGCPGLRELRGDVVVSSWIDVAGTQLRGVPPGCRGAALRWRGVFIEARVAFSPETIAGAEVLRERNTEVRRVLMERMGYARFLEEVGAEELDRDTDAGGERRLLRVALEEDEPLVCVAVRCPSTGRQYMIRVPPTIKTCRKAVAWVAGFDHEKDYRPVVET